MTDIQGGACCTAREPARLAPSVGSPFSVVDTYASAPFDEDDVVALPLRRSFSPGDAPLLVLSGVELMWVVRVA